MSSENGDSQATLGCRAEINGEPPCGLKQYIADNRAILRRIEIHNVQVGLKLDKMASMESSLNIIAQHAGDTANQLASLRSDMQTWIPLIAGKKHVPLSIFLLVVGIMGALLMVIQLGHGGGELDAGPTHFRYRTTNGREDGPKTSPTPSEDSDVRRGGAAEAIR